MDQIIEYLSGINPILAAFLYGMDKVIPHIHINFPESEAEGIHTKM